MKTFLAASLFLLSHANAIAIRNAGNDTRIVERAPRTVAAHCGTLPLACKGIESVCNNACFHIKCVANGAPGALGQHPNRKTYVGPRNNAAQERNRFDSGNTMKLGGALCRTFPFSQVLVDDQAASAKQQYNTDEWPMASSQQPAFAVRGPHDQNSLRCVPVTENSASGRRFQDFEYDQGLNRGTRLPVCAGPMIAGDTYDVTFNLAGAAQARVNHCVDLNANRLGQNCDDPLQARLTSKSTTNGKASSPYDPPPGGTDNTYAIQYGTHPNIMQCSVEFMRSEHNEVEARVVDWDNQDQPSVRQNHANGQYTTTLQGLPYDLVVSSTGVLGTSLTFEYGHANTAANPNAELSHFSWNTDSEGAGAGVDGGQASRVCKVVPGTVQYNPQDATYHLGLKGDQPPRAVRGLTKQKTELTKCFFPCFMVANL